MSILNVNFKCYAKHAKNAKKPVGENIRKSDFTPPFFTRFNTLKSNFRHIAFVTFLHKKTDFRRQAKVRF